MFKIAEKIEFSRRVPVRVPTDGGFEEQSLEVRFRYIEEQERKRILEKEEERNAGAGFLRHAIVHIGDVVDEDGKALPYNDRLRDRLLDLPFVLGPLMEAYVEAVVGERAKN